MDYPPYACSCCGYANGDMFYDYILSTEQREPTEAETNAYWIYKKALILAQEIVKRAEQGVKARRNIGSRKKYTKRSAYWQKRQSAPTSPEKKE